MNTTLFGSDGLRVKLVRALQSLDSKKFSGYRADGGVFILGRDVVSDVVMTAHLLEELGFGNTKALIPVLERIFGESPVELVAETPLPEGPESGLDIQFVLFGSHYNLTLSGPTSPSSGQQVVVSGVFPWVVPYIGSATNDKWPWGD